MKTPSRAAIRAWNLAIGFHGPGGVPNREVPRRKKPRHKKIAEDEGDRVSVQGDVGRSDVKEYVWVVAW